MRCAEVVVAVLLTLATPAAPHGLLVPGLYADRAGRDIYIGVNNDGSNDYNDYYDPSNQRTDELPKGRTYRLIRAIHEERRVVRAGEGALGVSLYYAAPGPRPTIILVHGNNPQTREMGFIIPYFALRGVNVISYDQRGNGQSVGHWFENGPPQRADDIVSMYDRFNHDRHIDPSKIGIYGFSNGGWTAPIVAVRRHLAFVILGSAPTQTLRLNVDYEVMQEMRKHGFGAAAIPRAIAAWHAIEDALTGRQSWAAARTAYNDAKSRSWFEASLLPYFIKAVPPSEHAIAALRRLLIFDPAATLSRLDTPTLALYGKRDRNVDALDAASRLAAAASKSGLRDLTIVMYPDAGHLLLVSRSGYNDDATPPQRFVRGYPRVMIDWLQRHGIPVTKPA